MKKLLFALLALLTFSPAWAQATLHATAKPSKDVKPAPAREAARESARSLTPVLREVAQAVAVALGDAQTRRAVKAEVGKKFDGDFDVLYRDLANSRIGQGKTFRQALGGAVGMVQKRAGVATGSADAVQALDEYASALPQLQISVPAGFKDWDADKVAPLVAFVPADVDDSELREIEAFDAAGRRYMLDAQVEPMFPVVVVDLNERTDRNGYLRREFVRRLHPGVLRNPSSWTPTIPRIRAPTCRPRPSRRPIRQRSAAPATRVPTSMAITNS